jgi:hypothetical protein
MTKVVFSHSFGPKQASPYIFSLMDVISPVPDKHWTISARLIVSEWDALRCQFIEPGDQQGNREADCPRNPESDPLFVEMRSTCPDGLCVGDFVVALDIFEWILNDVGRCDGIVAGR